eukprot:g4702.t1
MEEKERAVLRRLLRTQTRDYLSVQRVPIVSVEKLTPLKFYREYVALSRPVIIDNLVDWPAMRNWQSDSYLEEACSNVRCTVNYTPDGRADAIRDDGTFMLPEEKVVSFGEFWRQLGAAGEGMAVPYLSAQNDSLRGEFQNSLMRDVDSDIEFAREAFGEAAEAANLWIGDGRSVSSLHKDPFENMYTVVRGEKSFLLVPPSDAAFLEEKEYPNSCFREGSIVSAEGKTAWLSEESLHSDDISPVRVVVKPGQTLYLPALWHHKVSQRGITIAINFWYNMAFGPQFCLYNLARAAAGLRCY